MRAFWVLALLLVGCPGATDDGDANDDDASDDDDADDDDSTLPPVFGCGVTDPLPSPVDSDDPQACVDNWPVSPWGADDGVAIPRNVHMTMFSDFMPLCGVGCEARNWATRVADRPALDALLGTFGDLGSVVGMIPDSVFETEQVFLLTNVCGGGGEWLQPRRVGVAPDGSLVLETWWHNDEGNITGAETAHLTVFSVPCNAWEGGDVHVLYGGAG